MDTKYSSEADKKVEKYVHTLFLPLFELKNFLSVLSPKLSLLKSVPHLKLSSATQES
jgi:hypothetical protein